MVHAHTPPRRGSAWGRGVWTLAEASVECGVMSGLAAMGADEACCAERRDSAPWREPRSALSEIGLRHHAFLLARIRLTRTAAERGPVLSGACGQDAMAEINQ
jgi:hypothetical protein